MILDAAVLALLAVASAIGAAAGLLRPLFAFAGATLGWLAARHLSAPLGGALSRVVPAAAAVPVAAVLLFVGVAGFVAFLGGRLARGKDGGGRPVDRAAGALLAGLALAAAAWVALAVADAAAPHLSRAWQEELSRSDLAGLVRSRDVLGEWRRRAEAALDVLLHAAADPAVSTRLAADPELRGLVDDPRVRALVDEARAAGRAEAARSQEAIRLLADPAFRARLEAAQERLDRAGR